MTAAAQQLPHRSERPARRTMKTRHYRVSRTNSHSLGQAPSGINYRITRVVARLTRVLRIFLPEVPGPARSSFPCSLCFPLCSLRLRLLKNLNPREQHRGHAKLPEPAILAVRFPVLRKDGPNARNGC